VTRNPTSLWIVQQMRKRGHMRPLRSSWYLTEIE
jgi:hypothetical protein